MAHFKKKKTSYWGAHHNLSIFTKIAQLSQPQLKWEKREFFTRWLSFICPVPLVFMGVRVMALFGSQLVN